MVGNRGHSATSKFFPLSFFFLRGLPTVRNLSCDPGPPDNRAGSNGRIQEPIN
jgi:hypothetical protein